MVTVLVKCNRQHIKPAVWRSAHFIRSGLACTVCLQNDRYQPSDSPLCLQDVPQPQRVLQDLLLVPHGHPIPVSRGHGGHEHHQEADHGLVHSFAGSAGPGLMPRLKPGNATGVGGSDAGRRPSWDKGPGPRVRGPVSGVPSGKCQCPSPCAPSPHACGWLLGHGGDPPPAWGPCDTLAGAKGMAGTC